MTLFSFKYLSFIDKEINTILGRESNISIALPIGISFFIFQMMSYIFDVYYEKVECQNKVINLGLYISFFPQLIAGPIVRYETINHEIENRRVSINDYLEGLYRFIFGLGKKVLIADFLAIIADNIFSLEKYNSISMLTAWIGAIAYTLEIYFDFSGYSDMAIGLGRMFGFHFNENFRYPYVAKSISDFWKRWHISLTDWFRDYVYIPLGGNRVNKWRHLLNISIVWILTGIWHGANWTFLLWGMIYCVFQILEKYVYKPEKWKPFLAHMYTLIIVTLCWVLFRADNILDGGRYVISMFHNKEIIDTLGLNYLSDSIVIVCVAVLCSVPIKDYMAKYLKISKSLLDVLKCFAAVIIVVMAAFVAISGGYSPFIYFNF